MSIIIACPRCHKPRNMSHLPKIVSDWENLLPIIALDLCGTCTKLEILKSLKVGQICLYMGPEDEEEIL